MANTSVDIKLTAKSQPTINITTIDSGVVTGSALTSPIISYITTGPVGAAGVAGAAGTPGLSIVNSNSVNTQHIINDAVTGDKIAHYTITGINISPGSITGDKLEDHTVTEDKIMQGAITASKIAEGAITEALNGVFSDGAITESKIKNLSLGPQVLSSNAIITSKIADRNVTGAKIAIDADLDGEVKANNLKLKGSSPATLTGPDSYALQLKTNTTLDVLNTSGETKASIDQSGNLTLSGTVDGRDVAVDGAKLDTISANDAIDWTTDQGGTNIHAGNYTDTNTTYSEATGSAEGLMSITHHDKLDGIEVSADVTDATNVTAAGALMDSEVTNLAQVKAFSSADYATAAQGTKADSAQQPPTEGAFADGDKTKLNGIETGATADQTQADINGLAITTVGTIGTGAWQGTAIASNYLDSDTAHLSGIQTFLGQKTFSAGIIQDGDLTITPGDDGVALHIDAADITDGSTSASGTTATFNHVSIENPRVMASNALVTTTNASTVYIKGAPVASSNQTITNAYALNVAGGNVKLGGDLEVGGDLQVNGSNSNINLNAGSDIILEADNDGGSGSSSIQYKDSGGGNKIMLAADSDVVILSNRASNGTVQIRANTSTAGSGGEVTVVTVHDDKVDISKNLNVTGVITGKQRQIYQQSFIDDLSTTKHYLPWRDTDEQTTIYQEEAAMVAPYDGRIVSVTMRCSSLSGSGNRTIGIHTFGPNASQFTTGNWTEEEVEAVAIESTDDNHVFYFVFDNAKHFESGELITLSIQDDSDLTSGSRYTYVSTVVEWDYNNGLGTGASSAEYDAAQ